MGTTLTGTTPQDTYDSLIKVTDNGPLSATGKYLSDGLGNDSALALSTATVGVGTASNSYTSAGRGNLNIAGSAGAIIGFQIGGTPKGYVFHDSTNLQLWNEVAGDLLFGANATERMRILSGGNVGIGTNAPALALELNSSTTAALPATAGGTQSTGGRMRLTTTGASTAVIDFGTAGGSGGWIQATNKSDLTTQYALLLNPNGGSVGVGTTAPAVKLDVVGNIRSSTGILFGTDTAAANLLDDYEEGTWTMGVSFGGLSVGVTTSSNTGTYTKIGRQVTVNGYLALTNKGSSTGAAKIKGLPFTVGNTTGNLAAAAARFDSITFANQFQIHAEDNTTTMALEEITEAGAVTTLSNSDFANSCSVLLSCTYFV